MPHFPRCERTQHKIIMAESGSRQPFAASCLEGCFGDQYESIALILEQSSR